MNWLNWRLLILLSVSLLLCQSCAYNYSRTHYEKVRLMTAADYKAAQIIGQLQKHNVQVFSDKNNAVNANNDALGVTQIFINNDIIFNKNSANFNANARNVLDNMVALLNCYEEDVVKIQGSVSGAASSDTMYKNALMMDRAHKVAQYLWSQDVNATFLYAMSNTIPHDHVAITFQRFRRD